MKFKKRSKMSKGKSKKVFKHNSAVHPKNAVRTVGPMRGGIRL